jgi:hypothetical protein
MLLLIIIFLLLFVECLSNERHDLLEGNVIHRSRFAPHLSSTLVTMERERSPVLSLSSSIETFREQSIPNLFCRFLPKPNGDVTFFY